MRMQKKEGSRVQQSNRAIEQQEDTTAKTFSLTAALLRYCSYFAIHCSLFTVLRCL